MNEHEQMEIVTPPKGVTEKLFENFRKVEGTTMKKWKTTNGLPDYDEIAEERESAFATTEDPEGYGWSVTTLPEYVAWDVLATLIHVIENTDGSIKNEYERTAYLVLQALTEHTCQQ